MHCMGRACGTEKVWQEGNSGQSGSKTGLLQCHVEDILKLCFTLLLLLLLHAVTLWLCLTLFNSRMLDVIEASHCFTMLRGGSVIILSMLLGNDGLHTRGDRCDRTKTSTGLAESKGQSLNQGRWCGPEIN